MSQPVMSAVGPAERLRILDVLRGFAIFGILLVNVHFYGRPIYVVFRDGYGPTGALDQVIKVLTMFLASEKFFSILSVLFGIGMAILFERTVERKVSFGFIVLRRLLGLFAIGITHALALYSGDFIGNYAVLGLILLLFSRAGPRTLLACGAIALLVPCLMMAPSLLSRPVEPTAAQDRQQQEARREKRKQALTRRVEQSVQVYGRGDVQEIFRLRSREVVFQYSSLLFIGWKMFSMFLLGLWCWRSGLVSSLERRLPFVRKVMWIALVVALAGNFVSVHGELASVPRSSTMQFFEALGQAVGAPALAIFYMTGIALLYFGGIGRPLLDALAPVGRMAMSNYVFQSLVCTTIFYSYAFGLFYRTTYATNVLVALGLFVVQVILSRLWLKRFAFGPLEWVLRSFVYLRRPSAA